MIEGHQLGSRESHLTAEVSRLRQKIEQLKQSNHDLQLALSMTAEHGDLIETQLFETNRQLQAEIAERKKAQAMLQALLEIISREKDDLEIVVQTIMEHGDILDTQWQLKLFEVRQLAALDGLTQVANRRRFDEHLNQQWKQMARDHVPISIIMCDIDCFKQYNDTYGHLAGDDCLKQVAQTLSSVINRPNDLLARYGGEEFAAILPQTRLEGAVKVAERMQAAIALLEIVHPNSLVCPHITLSIGVACTIPFYQQDAANLVDEADQLLYHAKQKGRNQIVYRFVPGILKPQKPPVT